MHVNSWPDVTDAIVHIDILPVEHPFQSCQYHVFLRQVPIFSAQVHMGTRAQQQSGCTSKTWTKHYLTTYFVKDRLSLRQCIQLSCRGLQMLHCAWILVGKWFRGWWNNSSCGCVHQGIHVTSRGFDMRNCVWVSCSFSYIGNTIGTNCGGKQQLFPSVTNAKNRYILTIFDSLLFFIGLIATQ